MKGTIKLDDLQYIIHVVRDALSKNAIDAAFFCSLSIPDLCGQMEYPQTSSVKKRYSDWYNSYIYKYENPTTSKDKINQIDGDVIYLLRCKLFHETSLYHKQTLSKIKKKYAQRSKVKLENVSLKLNFDSDVDKIQVISISKNTDAIKVIIHINKALLARKLLRTAEGFFREKKSER